jgi:tungstate transport system permease protein
MSDFSEAFAVALALILNFESSLAEIVGLSLQVSLVAVFITSLIGLPLGSALAVFRFPGRKTLVVILNALMGLPPVVVGLIVYLILSRSERRSGRFF